MRDLVERNVAITSINKLYEKCEEWRALNDLQYGTNRGLSLAIEAIEDLPPVTQKSGVWVEIDDEPHEVWECNHCGFVIDGSGCIEPYEYRDTYKYCPNCGAYMKGES